MNKYIVQPVVVSKIAEWLPTSVDWLDAVLCGVSSGSTLFTQACLSEYLRL